MKPLILPAILLVASAMVDGQIKPSKFGPVSEGHFTGADGVSLFYRKVGVGKEVLVFLHGGPGLSIGDGGYDVERLAKGRTLLMYDQRGSGRSQVITDPGLLGAEYHVRDLEAFRKHFNLERMTLIGLSWGTGLATLYDGAYPDRVDRLVLLSPLPPARVPFLERRNTAINAVIGPAGVARLAAIRDELSKASDEDAVKLCKEYFQISSPPYLVKPKAFTKSRSDLMCDGPPAGVKNRFVVVFAVVQSIGDWDFRPQLAKMKIPTLVVEGEKSNVPLESARIWAATLPNGKLALIPDAGHLPFIEQPAAFAKAVNDFLTSRN